VIIKAKDSLEKVTEELLELMKLPLDNRQKSMVERELRALNYGVKGEQDSAYFLDFHFGNSRNWAVIHDFRIEWQGRVAQIDHVLANRFLEVFVLETKNFFGDIKINDQGEFSVVYAKKIYGIESPVEQNKRHVAVLRERIEARGLAPTRLGFPLPVTYLPYVLVSPKSNIVRPHPKKFDASMVIKADQFRSEFDRLVDQASPISVLATASKMIGTDTLESFARGIAGLHRPGKFNYRAKFGIPDQLEQVETKSMPVPQPPAHVPATEWAGKCDKCGAGVEGKVVAYCRFNRAKLGGHKVLCRDCQKSL